MSVILRYTDWVKIIEDGVLETKPTFVGNMRPAASFFSGDFLVCITWDKTISTSQYDCFGLNQSMVGSEACGTLITIKL